jgi:hypothetical protein
LVIKISLKNYLKWCFFFLFYKDTYSFAKRWKK